MACPFPLQLYAVQKQQWPSSGRHILAHYDDDQVAVYQAYKSSIGHPAARHQDFVTSNPHFSLDRMTWIKPNFLWMMYRSGWGTKQDQEVVLAISLSRSWFEELLATKAVLSHQGGQSCQRAQVVAQWDPDHDPLGKKETRRALQIGLRDEVAQEFAKGTHGPAVLAIRDVSDFVRQTKVQIIDQGFATIQEKLETPIEKVCLVSQQTRDRLEMDV